MSIQRSSKLLINEPPLQVLPSLAVRHGLNEAIFIQQLHWMLGQPQIGKVIEDRKWVFNTLEDWQAVFPFWGKNTVRRVIEKLVKAGVVLEGNYNDSLSRTKWYTLDYDKLDSSSVRKPRKQRVDMPNFGDTMRAARTSKVRTNDDPKLGHTIVQSLDVDPKTSTETTTEISPLPTSSSDDPFGSDLDYIPPKQQGQIQAAQAETAAKRLAEPVTPSKQIGDIAEGLREEPKPPVAAVPLSLVMVDGKPHTTPAHWLPPAPEGYRWLVSSVAAAGAHLLVNGASYAAGKPLCKASVPHRVDINDPVGRREPCPECVQIASTRFVITNEVKDAFAILCYGTVDAWKMNANASLMMKALKQLHEPTIEALRKFYCNWRDKDFRSKQGHRPEPMQVVSKWTVYTTEDCQELVATPAKPALNYDDPHSPELQRAMAANGNRLLPGMTEEQWRAAMR